MHLVGKFIEFPPASNVLSARAFQENRTNYYPLAATVSLLCLSQMLRWLNVLRGNKRTELKGNRLLCSELLSVCLSKLPGYLCMRGRKQFPRPCLIEFYGYMAGLSKLLSVLNKRIQTPKLQ